MKGTITFNKSGKGSVTGRLNIPPAYLELLGITKDERHVDISFIDGQIVIKKIKKKE